MTIGQISFKKHRLYNTRGKSMRFAKRRTAKANRRAWKQLGEEAPPRITKGWDD